MAEPFLDATAQAELIRTGQASPLELVDDAINRAEKLNDELNAIIHPLYEQARERARGPLPDGPFRGVPIVFKDLDAAVEGDLHHQGLKVLRDLQWRAPRTDALAQKFLDAGFVCIGRANAPEFGLVPTTEPEAYGPTRNPWDTTRTTGGSSGGSAAAVASGIVPVAHANDGGGSIRIPASCCGLVGLKPSRGRVSFMPETTILEDMLVVQGCVSRSVRDTAAVLDAVQGSVVGDTVRAPEPARPYREEVGVDPGKLRIALLAHNPLGTGEIHPDCVAATRRAAALLESLGHTVEDAYPESIADEALLGHFMNLWAGNLAFAVRATETKIGRPIRAEDVEALTWSLAELGNQVSAADYIAAEHAIIEMTREVEEWFATASYDLVLTPTLGEPPVPLGTFQTPGEPMLGFMRAATFVPFTPLNNMTGSPAISLPLDWNEGNLPVGVQLQSAYGREDLLLRVAAQLEAAQPWADRVPPVHA